MRAKIHFCQPTYNYIFGRFSPQPPFKKISYRPFYVQSINVLDTRLTLIPPPPILLRKIKKIQEPAINDKKKSPHYQTISVA